MIDPRFEDHCWQGLFPPDILEMYAHYARETFVGPRPALLAIDLYELVYRPGPSSCGEHAWNAIPPTQRLFGAAREAGIPIFYSTQETRPDAHARVAPTRATKRGSAPSDPALYEIKAEFAPQPGDTVVRKMRASALFGTPLVAQLTQLGVQTLVVCGESTSGCVRASAVDAFSYGFHVVLVEECCFDRNPLSHRVNLFDLHHKYADVLHVDEVVDALARLRPGKAS